jgi:hypothetical protein
MTAWGGATSQTAGLNPAQIAALDRAVAAGGVIPPAPPSPYPWAQRVLDSLPKPPPYTGPVDPIVLRQITTAIANAPTDTAVLASQRAAFQNFGPPLAAAPLSPYAAALAPHPLMKIVPYQVPPAPAGWSGAPTQVLGFHMTTDQAFGALTLALTAAGCPPAALTVLATAYLTGTIIDENTRGMNRLAMPTLTQFNDMTGHPVYWWPDGTVTNTPPTWPGYHGRIISKPAAGY